MNGADETKLAVAASFIVRDFMCTQPGEQLLITADTASDPRAVQALLEAAKLHKARAALVTIPQLPFQGTLADPFVPEPLGAAVKSCDVWLDLTFPYLAGAGVHAEAMKLKRARCLHLLDLSADGFARLFAGVDFDRLFDLQEALDEIVTRAQGKRCRVTNAAGTDVSFTISRPATRKTRRINEPGSYTPPGSAVLYPDIDSVRGTIVVEAAFHEYYAMLHPPISMDVAGRIQEVRGGGTQLKVMERALRRAGGGKYGSVIHFTHGFHPMARFDGGSLVESIRAPGNDAIGLGTPWWEPGGGENHPDALITMQSLWIDEQQIVRDGSLVLPELARLETALEPLAAF